MGGRGVPDARGHFGCQRTLMELLGWIALGTLVGSLSLWCLTTDPLTRIHQILAGLGLVEGPPDDLQPSHA